MVPPKTATPSSARRSQAASAVIAWKCCGLTQCRKVLSAAPVMCVVAFNITASYAKRKRRKTPALRVRTRDRYVLRPSGKCRHTSQSQIPSPAVRGSKTGLVMHRPFAFCSMVVPIYLACLAVASAAGFIVSSRKKITKNFSMFFCLAFAKADSVATPASIIVHHI